MRVLKRPMFRKGGSTSQGIMTGLTDRKVDRQKYQQGGFEDPINQLLISGGLNLLSGSTGQGTLADVATSFKQPTQNLFNQLQAKKAIANERAFQEKLLEKKLEAQRDIAGMKSGLNVDKLAAEYLKDYDGDLNKATNKAKFFVEVRPELVKNYGETQIGGIIEVDLSNEKAAKSFAKQNRGKIGKVFYDINTGEIKKLIKNPKGELGFISVSSTAIPDTEGDDLPDSTKSKLGFEQTEYQKKIAKQTEEGLKRRKEEKKRKVDESLIGTSFEDLSG
jgi:hypothetical protein